MISEPTAEANRESKARSGVHNYQYGEIDP
jgi:hypothetical protein